MRKKTIALIVTVLMCLSAQFNANQQDLITNKSSLIVDKNTQTPPPISPPITPLPPDLTPGGDDGTKRT